MDLKAHAWSLAVRAADGLRNHAGLFGVLAIALLARLIYLHWFKTFPAADVFNFINIARGLTQGAYPVDEKRLPFFPLLILLFHAVLDWEAAAVTIAVLASLAALALFYAIGRHLNLPKTALCAILLVFQLQPQFFLASTRGYADTLLIALVLGAVLAMLRTRTRRGGIVTGALLGLATLTRYEGGAVSVLLLPTWFIVAAGLPAVPKKGGWLQRRIPVVVATVTAIVVFLPYVVIAATNDRPLIGAGYAAEVEIEQPQRGAAALQPFLEHWNRIGKRLGLYGFWRVPTSIARDIAEDPLATARMFSQRLIELGDMLSLLLAAGVVVLLVRRHWWPLLVFALAGIAQSAIAAWYDPLERYDAFVIPFTLLASAAGLSALHRLWVRGTTADRRGRAVRITAGTLLLLLTGPLWTATSAGSIRDRQLKRQGRDYAMYLAIHAARTLPGRIVFPNDHPLVVVYFSDRLVPSMGPRKGESAAAYVQRLRADGVRYAVVSDSNHAWDPVRAEPTITMEQHFEWPEAAGETNRVSIYRIGSP